MFVIRTIQTQNIQGKMEKEILVNIKDHDETWHHLTIYIDIGCVKDQFQLESFAENFTYLCLGYYFFNNENYAIHAISLLDTFFLNEKTRMKPNLNFAQFVRGTQNTTKMGRGEGVISSRVYVTRL